MTYAILVYRDEAEGSDFDEELIADRIIGPFDDNGQAREFGLAYARQHAVEWDILPISPPNNPS